MHVALTIRIAILALVIASGESSASSTFFQEGFNGPLEDTRCNIEVVEHANRAQLYQILDDLCKLTFFRLFRVDLRGTCTHFPEETEPLQCEATEEEEEESPANPFNPFLQNSKPKKESSCAVEPEPEDLTLTESNGSSTQGTAGVNEKLTKTEIEQTDQLDGSECDDEKMPEFWMDICSAISTNASGYINLKLNPEQNTAYDGRHIWKEIYKENCFASGSSGAPQCYEEKVMYRLLSGMHSSTSLSIFSQYHAPRKKGDEWRPNSKKFMEYFGHNPEWLKNLHFAFVVILRSLRKAKTFLMHYDYSALGADEKTTELVHLFLQSDVMSLCSAVFDSFDEKTLFRDTSGSHLRRDFKKAFHNISRLINCVKCQKCRVHAKLHTLGIGTALKILLLPDHLYTTSVSREEIVALFNTARSFSKSIKDVTMLTQLYHREMDQEVAAKTASVFGMDSLAIPDLNNMSEEKVLQLEKVKDAIAGVLKTHYRKNQILKFDAVVVGSGLAGMSAALTVLKRGGTVALIEKEKSLGGNSNKASSGINAAMTLDDLMAFANDTVKSAGYPMNSRIEFLVKHSKSAVNWLKEHGVKLDNSGQLGGHSKARTFRPSDGMIGAEVTFNMEKRLRAYPAGQLSIFTQTNMTSLLVEVGEGHREVFGVKAGNAHIYGPVILATGGFGHNFAGNSSLMTKYRPDLLSLPTTLGAWTQGEGIKVATSIGADIVDMDKVQIHPTGFIDPQEPKTKSKTLAAELLRGVGGILLNREGKRFCDELGTRAYIVEKMMEQKGDPADGFWLILSDSAADKAERHKKLYTAKGLLRIVARSRLDALIPGALAALAEYQEKSVKEGNDPFGKKYFHNVPTKDTNMFYVGLVTPVIHYTMGGVRVNDETQVLTTDGQVITNLFAVGEVSGGLHGNNRLGGNSLLECTVFGRTAGKQIKIGAPMIAGPISDPPTNEEKKPREQPLRPISRAELAKHNTREDCWVQLHDNVYDFSQYAELHPGGIRAITDFAGKDATANFEAVHNTKILEDFADLKIGFIAK
eukprot:GEMP01002831.1.p1 GENE.GEMP01002831.1~~GEMP01002831.1.p1  ORF type:complete len:1035 (+),score=189.60 GEMP01002831.1:136-3240(+)